MADHYSSSARDLADVSDDSSVRENQPQPRRLPSFRSGPRGTSPSPIRGTSGESPSRLPPSTEAAAAASVGYLQQQQPQQAHRQQSVQHQEPFHFTSMAPPKVGPAAPAHAAPLPHPNRPETRTTSGAASAAVEGGDFHVPIAARPTGAALNTASSTATTTSVPVPGLSGAVAASSQSSFVPPKRLLFTDDTAALPSRLSGAAGKSPSKDGAREERETSAPPRRTSSSVLTGPADLSRRSSIRFDNDERTEGNHSRNNSNSNKNNASATMLESGKLQVRVTRDGKTTVEEMDPNELARLYAQQQAALQKMRGQFDFLTVPDWVRLHPMLGPYVAEATGTFAWVLTLSLTSIRNQSIFNKADDTNVTCVPIGFMFTSMVFTFGYISGGHFNPAISLAVFLIRKMDLMRCLGYMICQVAAAFGAGVIAMLIQGNSDIFVPSVESSFVSSGIFAELIYTFAIALVVLNIGYSRQSGNFFYGFAIGMTMAAGSASVGSISGGAFNPAAATGLQLAVCMAGNCNDLKSFWIYWLAPLVGAIIASLLYSQMYQPEHTQVLQDHKVVRDPTKTLHSTMAAGGAHEDADAAKHDGDGGGHRVSDSSSSRSSSNGSDSGSDADGEVSRQRRRHGGRGNREGGVDGEDSNDVEMTSTGRPSPKAILNDSLTEPAVSIR